MKDRIDVPKFITEGDYKENRPAPVDMRAVRAVQVVGSIICTMFLMKFGERLVYNLKDTFIILGCLICVSWILWTIKDQVK